MVLVWVFLALLTLMFAVNVRYQKEINRNLLRRNELQDQINRDQLEINRLAIERREKW